MTRIAIIGAGALGETILSGLLRAGWSTGDIVATVRRPERAAELTSRYGIRLADNPTAVHDAKTVLIAVKPQDIVAVLDEIAPAIDPGAVVASVAAGVATDVIETHLPAGTAVVRIMQNTPARVDAGMATLSGGRHASESQTGHIAELLAATGQVSVVPERYQDAVTAISGTGPAYLFFVVDSMIEAGVHLGLPRDTATELVIQTMYGSAKLLRETGEHPAVLRERVTSPAGTTAAAIRVLEDHKVRAAFLGAMAAACDRSHELAESARQASAPDTTDESS
jgi:pyrroline-5-carboxylate reductase